MFPALVEAECKPYNNCESGEYVWEKGSEVLTR